ncbi:MAG: ATP-binding protein [Acidimicrobiaceae bacterium]|nr:ATP-binding protein [Acidimicrobiaceae bacterium]MDE0516170.1 ATP-binding protein [Acidimicrobiaceae bacterium]
MAATVSRTASPQGSELLLELDDQRGSPEPAEARSSGDESTAAASGASNGSYDADSIETLEGLEAVRKRPAMYVGGNGSDGLMHLVWEIVDNAVDEAAAGFATRVDVTLHRNGSVEVVDDGRGIPVDKHPDRDVSALEVVFSELHAGGKFGEGAYKASGGLHGVGAAVVNALSTQLDVQVQRDGYLHELSFKHQKPGLFENRRFVEGSELRRTRKRSKATATRVKFLPDTELFHPDASIDVGEVRRRFRQTCFLVPGLRMTLQDNRAGSAGGEPFDFVSRGGLTDLVKDRSSVSPVTGVITLNGIETFTEKVPVEGRITEVERECRVDIAMRWVSGYDTDVAAFVNTIPTPAGGTHLAGFDRALTRVVNSVLLKDNRKLARMARQDKNGKTKATKDDVQEGLVAAVKVTFSEPQFRGQTKQELGTPALEGIVARIAYEQLKEWFEPGGGPRSQVKALSDKLADAVMNRVASKQMLDTKRKAASLGSTGMPDKLADCRIHGDKAELILVEGDSAAGPAKRGRDSEFMAILPLRGKIVNAAKASPKQVLDNAEAQAIFTAMGAGAGDAFDIEAARYGRIVILCDADVDGSHIRCLLLTLIHGYMREMLVQGRVFSAQPPLYTARVGDRTYRAYSDGERDRITGELCRGKRRPENVRWQRFKGLGEMNTDELRHCALDPDTRTLRRLTMADAQQADAAAEMFDVLMGSDVAVRRDYLVENSSLVDEATLDI